MRTLLIVLALSVGSAHGAPILWTLDNVVTGGVGTVTGTVTGAFTYDSQTSVYTNIDLTYNASPDSQRPELVDIPLTVENPVYTDDSQLRAETEPSLYSSTGGMSVQLGFSGELTDAGGVLDVTSGAFRAWLYNTPISGGQIYGTVVPLPAAFWLFGSALVGLGWMRRSTRFS